MAIKQVVVIRTDLGMRKGKMIAQGAHASIAFITNKLQRQELGGYYITLTEPEQIWLEGRFTKICVRVDSEEELLNIAAQAKENGITCSLIQDAGLTEFGGIPTYTALALGPDYAANLDPITGDLKLL